VLTPKGSLSSSGPVTSETSKKIVSSLRALIAEFQAAGVTTHTAQALNAAQRFSSETLMVDNLGRTQVYVSLTDTSEATLASSEIVKSNETVGLGYL